MSGWIALVALIFTGTQAWIALRKLRLDLFAKRFDAWEAFNDALNDRLSAARDLDLSSPFEGDQEVLRRIWRLQRLMRALFPVDVSDSLNRIDSAMIARDVAQMELTSIRGVILYADQAEVTGKSAALGAADRVCREAQDELAKLVHRYIRQYGWIELVGVYARKRIALWQQTGSDDL
ncbi:hypothetical protein FV219_00545 [Methylobacterium sp. WL122]|nr:hypothetical protein FV219_00545 [Methylobacterium sp. WL122]